MTTSIDGLDAFGTFDALREAYIRYYGTAFRLRDERLQQERTALLDQPGGVYTEPQIELRPEYATVGRSLSESVAEAGAPAELADFAALGLLPPDAGLYTHQEKALAAAMQAGKNVVVTAGTGSGKTESFLLPVLADLLAESRNWPGGLAQLDPWWRRSSKAFASQRENEAAGRPKAVRTLVLYPMNALVDDQLVRLRRAFDSDAARTWLDTHRSGNRFFFGRYTGATPVTGSRDQPANVDSLRAYLKATEERSRRAVEAEDEDTRYFTPCLDGAEMRSRWDMHDAPPDIMITNYSMLNIMLLRNREQHFFETTRKWLETTPGARFTLVVDELHMYRGTAGTEVAYLIRNLKSRLGIIGRPDKLRIIAASASLDAKNPKDRSFLEGFFAASEASFEFIPGESKARRPAEADISQSAELLAGAAQKSLSARASRELLKTTAAADALVSALRQGVQEASAPALAASELAQRMFPAASEQAQAALQGTLAALRSAGNADPLLPKIRVHMFFRNVPGMWACTDPACADVSAQAREDRPLGRLFTSPRTRCTCGSRVLELLYCQSCGDALLGGYAPSSALGGARFDSHLLPDTPDLSQLPDQARRDRTAANYLVYWPSRGPQHADDDAAWTKGDNAITFAFRRSALDPKTGSLRNSKDNEAHTGWSFHVSTAAKGARKADVDLAALPPFPTRCPSCSADWERGYRDRKPLPATDPLRFQSPVRTMRTGFEKINQVLTTELAGQFDDPANRKLIVFTDSRQDAAKLSAGLALRHYQDLVRLLAFEELSSAALPVGDIARARAFHDGAMSPENEAAFNRIKEKDKEAFKDLRLGWIDGDDTSAAEAALTDPPTLAGLAKTHVHKRLLKLGANPSGTKPSVQKPGDKDWHELYEWHNAGDPRLRRGLTEAEREAAFSSEFDLLENTVEALFSGGGRDFESLGLGWIDRPGKQPTTGLEGVGPGSLRVLAQLRRFDTMRDSYENAPRKLREYWQAIADANGMDRDDVADTAAAYWGDSVRGFLINPEKVIVRPAGEEAWNCPSCRRQHLTRSGGTCTGCGKGLLEQAEVVCQPDDDYYAWKAATGHGSFRLNCAELTGQTGRIEAQARQARFQRVFLDGGEEPLVHELDLLSVTTTMEAGVDIGPLSAAVMANMPPTRFNYQQRVGRAGRRSSPVAVALTVCRGRSHDEHYFRNPSAVTNDPAPSPYLALDRLEILRRAVASEVLRRAFDASGIDGGSNVHGAFGLCEDWESVEPGIRTWIDGHRPEIRSVAEAFTSFSPFSADTSKIGDGWIRTLLDEISVLAEDPTGCLELSERLADRGVLPMFGFPTRVRQLYLEVPKSNIPWPPDQAVARDIALAVSGFAPGSEIVRDSRVYTVIGVTDFLPGRPRPRAVSEPLLHPQSIGLCPTCHYIDPSPKEEIAEGQPCPMCEGHGYQGVDLREPAGFRAAVPPRDFDGNFAWSPRTVSSRATAELNKLQQTSWEAAELYAGSGDRYIVNDNNGASFTFQKASPTSGWGGYVAAGALDHDPRAFGTGEPFKAALGAVVPTDFLFIGPRSLSDPTYGYRLNLAEKDPRFVSDFSYGRRAAWYSLAFLLRGAAARFLDVHPQELIAGIHAGRHPEGAAQYAFIADSLENGAGFSTHLGSPDVAPEFMGYVDRWLDALADHADKCTSSCYDCLRDYSNMAYHPLLDWRLAADLFRVLSGRDLAYADGPGDAVLHSAVSIGQPTRLSADTPVVGVRYKGKDYAVVTKHPLEACEVELATPRIQSALDAALAHAQSAERVIVTDWFTLDKSPLIVLNALAPRRRL